jgi:hypothetical protein
MIDNDPLPNEDQTKKPSSGGVSEVELKPMGRVKIEHHDAPPPGPADKKIHQRHPLPPVPPAANDEENKRE